MRALLALNVAAYVVWNLFLTHFETTAVFVYRHVALNPGFPGILVEPWQLLSYGFLHLGAGLGGMLHLVFNMLWIMWIGRDYEELYGPGRILGIYVYGAVGGAVLTVLLHAVFPGVNLFGGIVHGASGAVLALMTLVAIHQPQKQIGLMFIGVVRLIHVVMGFIALDILFLSAGGTSVSAHLGGVVVGYLSGRAAYRGSDPTAWANVFFSDSRGAAGGGIFSRGRVSTSARGREDGSRTVGGERRSFLDRLESLLGRRKEGSSDQTATIHEMRPSSTVDVDGSSGEVDRILDKISEKGYDSLTNREKKILLSESGKGDA